MNYPLSLGNITTPELLESLLVKLRESLTIAMEQKKPITVKLEPCVDNGLWLGCTYIIAYGQPAQEILKGKEPSPNA